MKILLFGKNGNLGSELQRSLAPLGTLITLNRASTEHCGDLGNLDGIAHSIAAVRPDVIVNAAAYTAVDKAESEKPVAKLINTSAPEVMAVEAKRFNAKLIHFSTDYVFDGVGNKPYRESDTPNPINTYGQTKKDGEDAIIASGAQHIILRTSWVYGAAGRNFVKTIIELAKARETLNVINDQIGAPTGASMLADCTAQVIRHGRAANGIYHLTAAGETSWYHYAQFIVQSLHSMGMQLKLPFEGIKPIPSSDYPTPATRPLNSRLDTTAFKETFGITLPQWQNGVTALLTQLHGKQP
ncbi:MAG: dTDP-4-dehydrorhamnose reductase [Alphaproteobacteria bacterium]|nr:dTDP-4-dehydrorhamnose reductase [Alphaproteobacteria bacterium]